MAIDITYKKIEKHILYVYARSIQYHKINIQISNLNLVKRLELTTQFTGNIVHRDISHNTMERQNILIMRNMARQTFWFILFFTSMVVKSNVGRNDTLKRQIRRWEVLEDTNSKPTLPRSTSTIFINLLIWTSLSPRT